MRKKTMEDGELDRALSSQDGIQPSSGFVARVMEAVEHTATAPPPIPFPWKRALPFVCLSVLTLISVVVAVVVIAVQAGSVATSTSPAAPALAASNGVGGALTWAGLALLGAYISVKASMRLAGGRS